MSWIVVNKLKENRGGLVWRTRLLPEPETGNVIVVYHDDSRSTGIGRIFDGHDYVVFAEEVEIIHEGQAAFIQVTVSGDLPLQGDWRLVGVDDGDRMVWEV